MKTLAFSLAALAAIPLTACQSTGAAKSRGVATAAQTHSGLDQVKALAGTWDVLDDKGNSTGTTTFAVSSKGSVVREVMLVGTDHEMTNMYHMDGPTMVVTHYCAVGNQPLMRAAPEAIKPGRIAFTFDHASNYNPSVGGHVMGDLTLVMVDADHLRQEWASYDKGKPAGNVAFELRRRK